MKNGGQPQPILERMFKFAVRIVNLCGLRAGTSVGANVEEAQGAQSKADFNSKMSIALKEARETHFRLRVLAAASVVPQNRLDPLVKEADEIQRIIGAIIVSSKDGRS